MKMTLGSLFDGSGGFPLAGALCGVEPRWASEIEPYPIAVTRSRFPNMKHLGSITDIDGSKVEPVDIITFGSPCQDLSVAGKRAGLKHEANGDDETTRSGLFMEAVRIIKQMREATNGEYPKFCIWENVPGAFSSNKGEDFRIVLAELIAIVEPSAAVPPVPKAGWAYADSFVGDGWSLAYRVFDAQYWGVPQRRRRIHLVLDLRGERAREVLFEREGVRGYFAQGRTPWQGAAANAECGAGADDREGVFGWPIGFRPENTRLFKERATTLCNGTRTGYACGIVEALPFDTTQVTSPQNGNNPKWGDPCHPLAAQGHPPTVIGKIRHLYENHSQDTRYKGPLDICPMLPAQLGTDGNNTPFVVEEDLKAYSVGNGQMNQISMAEQCNTLDCMHDKQAVLIAHGVNIRAGIEYPELYPTLQAKSTGGHSLNYSGVCRIQYIVRRLTPTECAKLQGFADRWGDIDEKDSFMPDEYHFWMDVRNTHAAINGKQTKKYTIAQMLKWYNSLHTDSAEYKLWGNGIALPPALYCMQGIADALSAIERTPEDATVDSAPNAIAPDIAESEQSTLRIDVDALLQIEKMRAQLTSQQYKTLRGQVLAGVPMVLSRDCIDL